jgi:DNA-binding response OmpR family regulator
MLDHPHVLVIDPSPAILDSVSLLLTDEGYAVSTARVMPAAPVLRAIRPDIVVCEPLGPADSLAQGLEMLSRLGRALRAAPLVVCTAAATIIEPCRVRLEAQGVRVIYKPFEIDALLAAVAACVQRGSARARQPVLIEC